MVKWLMQVAVNEGCAIIVSHALQRGLGTRWGEGESPRDEDVWDGGVRAGLRVGGVCPAGGRGCG